MQVVVGQVKNAYRFEVAARVRSFFLTKTSNIDDPKPEAHP